MPLRRGFPGQSRQSQRRLTAWGIGPNATGLSLSSTSSQLWTNGVVLAVEERATIVRIRGVVHALEVNQDSVHAGFAGAIGIGLVNSQAFAAGIAAVPSPITEIDWPGWMYYQMFDIRAVTATESDGANAQSIEFNAQIDSKSMRKWGPEETMFGAIEVVEIGVAQMNFDADTRVLVKLS